MTSSVVYMVCGTLLFFIGALGIVFCSALLRKVLALNIAGAGVFLFLVASAYRGPGQPADPVPQALVLTGIVIAASATAMLLFLVTRVTGLAATDRPPEPTDPAPPDRSR